MTGENSPGDGEGSLRYLSYWTEGEPTSEILKEAFADFEQETGIAVEVKWQGRDLPDILAAQLSSSDPSVDMVDFACSTVAQRLVATGKAADLSSVLSEEVPGEQTTVEETLVPAALATGKGDGTTFCIPFQMTSDQDIWFNAANHPGLADAPPETWSAFLDVLDKSGPGSVALDGTIGAYAMAWFVNLAVSATGEGGLLNAASDKTGEALKDPGFVEAAGLIEQLVDGDYFAEGYAASKFPAIQQKWANNEAQFILVGSWLPAEVAPYAAEGFEYASFPFPAIEEGAVRPMQIDTIGFAGIEGAANVDNAKKFMAFFLQKKYQDQIAQIAIPARPDADVVSSLKYVQQALTDDSVTKIAVNDGTTGSLDGWEVEVLEPIVQRLIFGEISADDFITQISTRSKEFWDLRS